MRPSCSREKSTLAETKARGLLISWPTPAARVPTAIIRSIPIIRAVSDRRWVMSREMETISRRPSAPSTAWLVASTHSQLPSAHRKRSSIEALPPAARSRSVSSWTRARSSGWTCSMINWPR